jgi:hypothetical protein
MVFARVPEELLGVEVSDRSQRQSWRESLTKAVWTLIKLCLHSRESILKPGASQLVYRAAFVTMERSIARRKPVGAVRHWRLMPFAFAPCPPVFNLAASKDVDARCDSRSSDSEHRTWT